MSLTNRVPTWAVEGDVLQYPDGTLNLWVVQSGGPRLLKIKARSVNVTGEVIKYNLNKEPVNG